MIVDSSELLLSCLPASLQDPKYTNKNLYESTVSR
jgi:hypothetical protein